METLDIKEQMRLADQDRVWHHHVLQADKIVKTIKCLDELKNIDHRVLKIVIQDFETHTY